MGFYTESAKQLLNNPMSIPEFLMECHHVDNALFEGLIELDFAEVYNESGIIALTEEDQKAASDAASNATKEATENIFKKFLNTLKGVFDKIKNALDKFFNSISTVSLKVIDDPKAKECKTKDIWYADYRREADKFNVLSVYEKAAAEYQKAFEACLGKDGDIDYQAYEEHLTETIKEIQKPVNIIIAIPTDVESYENSDAEVKVAPVELGSKSGEFGELRKALSVGGIGRNIGDVFKKLSTKEKLYTASEDETAIEAKARRFAATGLCTLKLALMAGEGRIISNSCKIARRNYKELAACVHGKEGNASEEKTQEASFLAGQFSDLFCESVFEF